MYGSDAKKPRNRYGYEDADADDSWRRVGVGDGDLRMTVGMHHESPAVLAARRTVQYLNSGSKAALSSDDNRSHLYSRDYKSGDPVDDDDYDLYGPGDGGHHGSSGGHGASSTMHHASRNSMRGGGEDGMDRNHGGVASFVSNRSQQYAEAPHFNMQSSNQVWVDSNAAAAATSDGRSRMLNKRPAEEDRGSSWSRSRIVLPTYAGTSDPKAPSAFVVELESYADDMGYGEMELLNSVLPNCMAGEAFQWLSSQRGFKSWEDFRRSFTLRFQPVAYPKRRRLDLQFRSQDPEESLTEFVYAIDAMFKQINPFASDAEKVQRALQSVNPRIQALLVGRTYRTIWEIAADAPMIEKSLQAQAHFSHRSPLQTQVRGLQRAGMNAAMGGGGGGGMSAQRGGKTRWDSTPATVTVRSREQWKPQNPAAALAAAKARIDRIVAAKMAAQPKPGFSQKQQGKGGWNNNKNASQKQVPKPVAASKSNQIKPLLPPQAPPPKKGPQVDRRGMPPLRKAVLSKGRAGVWVRDADVQVSPRLRSINTSADLVPEQDSVGAPVLDQAGAPVMKMNATFAAGMENVRLMWLRSSPPRMAQPNPDAETAATPPHSASKPGTAKQRSRREKAKPSSASTSPASGKEPPPSTESAVGTQTTPEKGKTQPVAAKASQPDPTVEAASVSKPDSAGQPAEPEKFKKPAPPPPPPQHQQQQQQQQQQQPPVEPPTIKEAQVAPDAAPVKPAETKTVPEQQQTRAVPAPSTKTVAKKAAASKQAASKESVPIVQPSKQAPVEPAPARTAAVASPSPIAQPVLPIATEAAPGMLQAALSALASQFASGPMAPMAQQMLQMQTQMLQLMFSQGGVGGSGGGGGGGPSIPFASPLVAAQASRAGRRAAKAAPVPVLPPLNVVVKQEVMDVEDNPEPAAPAAVDPEPIAGNEQLETAVASDAQEVAAAAALPESEQEPDERPLGSNNDQERASDGDREAANDDGRETGNADEQQQPCPADEGEKTDPVENAETEDSGTENRDQ